MGTAAVLWLLQCLLSCDCCSACCCAVAVAAAVVLLLASTLFSSQPIRQTQHIQPHNKQHTHTLNTDHHLCASVTRSTSVTAVGNLEETDSSWASNVNRQEYIGAVELLVEDGESIAVARAARAALLKLRGDVYSSCHCTLSCHCMICCVCLRLLSYLCISASAFLSVFLCLLLHLPLHASVCLPQSLCLVAQVALVSLVVGLSTPRLTLKTISSTCYVCS